MEAEAAALLMIGGVGLLCALFLVCLVTSRRHAPHDFRGVAANDSPRARQ
jgi:hypothetical protein